MLRKKQNILLLAALCAGSISSASVIAEEVPTIVISATRSEQPSVTTASNIVVIGQNQIEQSGASSVAEILRSHSGLVVSDQFGDGSQVSIGVRGFGESANANTLIMVDGRRLNNSDIASPDLHSISLIDIERIEIVYGSAGVLFGDQAVGGVVNIITKSIKQESAQIELVAGSYAKQEARLRMTGELKDDLSYKLILDHRTADNYRDHNEKDYQQATGLLSYRYKQGDVFTEWQYSDSSLNTPGQIFADDLAVDRRQVLSQNAEDFSDTKTNFGRVGIRHHLNDNWSIESELTGRHNDVVFKLKGTDGIQNREIYEFTPRAIGEFDINGKETIATIGMDFLASDYLLSSPFGDQLNDQFISSIYTQLVITLDDKTDVTVGGRYAEVKNDLVDSAGFTFPDDITIKDDATVFELGLRHKLDSKVSVFARVEENYRFAKVDEFMQPAFSGFSPVILETQTGLSSELGVDWNLSEWVLGISIFQLEIDDEIIFDSDNYANINIESTKRRGINLNSRLAVSKDLSLGMNASYIDAEVTAGPFVGKEVPYVPAVQVNAYTSYYMNSSLDFLVEAEYTDERVMSGDFSNNLENLPSYTVVNIVGNYKVENVVLKLRVNNLFDKEYSEFGLSGYNPATFQNEEAYYPSPERNISLSANIKF